MTVSVFAAAADRLQLDLDYGRDLAKWAEGRLGINLWSVQAQIGEELQIHRRVGVRSCNDAGKSFTAALVGCHHVDTHDVGTARLITTAPGFGQVRGVLWNEINSMAERARERGSPLKGRINQTEWWIDRRFGGAYLAGIGKKPADGRPEVMAGYHAEHVMVILDEADGLPPSMWDGIEALMTNEHARMLAIGNPLDPDSRFAKIDKDPTFKVMKISAFDTPNFTGEKVSLAVAGSLISKSWVESRRALWGEDHPFWYGRVLGEYPPEALATIIRAEYIEMCTRREDPVPTSGIIALGVDVANSDDGDVTSIHSRRGNTALQVWKIQTADDDAVEDFVVQCVLESGATRVVIDATGFGTFFPGRIRKRCRGVAVIGVNFSASADIKNPDGSKKYVNMRAQLYWETGRELLRTGIINLGHITDAEPPKAGELGAYERTVADLAASRYDKEALAKNLIQVESKAEVQRRLGRSPDDGDAHLLSFYEPPGGMGTPARVADTSRYNMPTGAASVTRR